MNTRILNRAGQLPEDGFYQIEAPGEHINHAARVIQVIDGKAVEAMVNRFNTESKAAEFAGMRIDKDHLSRSLDNATESLGWAMELRARDGIPEARIGWTGLGRPLIESKEDQPPVYKFFSTEYDPTQCEKIGTRAVGKKTYDIVRPLRLDGLSLTNDPNNKGQRPISNRDGKSAGDDIETQPATKMNKVIKLLGLADDASEDSVVTAVQAIQNRATKAEGQVTTLNTERTALLAAQVDSDLEKYKNRFKPENREKIKAALITNRASTIELLESLEAPAAAEDIDPATGKKRITNRAAAKTPEQVAAEQAAGKDEEARAGRITNRAHQIQKEKSTRGARYPFTQAFKEAEAAEPAAK